MAEKPAGNIAKGTSARSHEATRARHRGLRRSYKSHVGFAGRLRGLRRSYKSHA
jgi:hypothetical protein